MPRDFVNHSVMEPVDTLRSQGYLILKNLVPTSTIKQMAREIEPYWGITPKCQGDFYGWQTTRFGSVLRKSKISHELVNHPTIISIANEILGPYCDWIQLNLSQVVRIHPGSPAQPPHRDDEMWPFQKSNECLLNVIWPIDDFTAENGATRIWPRSQFQPLNRELDMSEADVAEMEQGSALIFLGSATHCGGANTSDLPRTGLIFSYALGWLKPYENPFLAYPPEIAKSFSKDIQDLIGYRIHRPNLGGYENNSPAVLLQDHVPEALPAVDTLPSDIAEELKKLRENQRINA